MKPIAIIAIISFFGASVYCQPTNAQMLDALHDNFWAKHNNTHCPNQIIQPHSLDNYMYSLFGKVALDNKDYIANATAFNASFNNSDAIISANYSKPLKEKSYIVWNLGGKAAAQDGTYFLFKSNQLNFTLGIKGGITILGDGNGVYYDKLDKDGDYTCQKISDIRMDSINVFLARYDYLINFDHTAAVTRIKGIDSVLSTPSNSNSANISNSQVDRLVKEKDSLNGLIKSQRDLQKDNTNLAKWADKIVNADFWRLDKSIVENYTTGFHIHWWNFSGEISNEYKNILDYNKPKLTVLRGFVKGTANATYNYYHLGGRSLFFFKMGFDLGNGYKYDLLTPDGVTVSTLLSTSGSNSVSKTDNIKAFNPYDNPTYDNLFFRGGLSPLIDGFFGKTKMFGLELGCNVALMANAHSVLAPFNFQGGILFSPIDKNKKTNEGTIGILVGMQKLDLTDLSISTSKNLFIGIRVGIPLGQPLTKASSGS